MIAYEIKPVGRRVLVRLLDPDEKTPGGIVLPDSSKKTLSIGVVQAVGYNSDDTEDLCAAFRYQDLVMFSEFCGTEVKIPTVNPGKYLLVNWQDIQAILTPKETE